MKRAHKRLDVWNEAMELTTRIYSVTEHFPKSELFGLVSQMRRAAVSVPSNIAEGAARNSTKEFLQFLNVAGGSLSELDTQIEIAKRLSFISQDEKEELDEMADSIARKTAGLIRQQREKL